ncbi:MAG: septum site-determining protein MinC [Defluviitaleaceae bacterium]|nr:septum site-determining protein MinC [Defluviitaleaceae bacterium]MCL2275880.1 septum site-determining protein MinC [Defluviitaleaceae bacterium]
MSQAQAHEKITPIKTKHNPQCVVLKGHKDGISVILDSKVSFEEIKKVLREKVSGAKRFFEGANATVSFKGRSLTEKQEKTLLDIIMSETTLDVAFVESEGFTMQPKKSAPAVTNSSTFAPVMEGDTAFYSTGLRSGQQVRYKGSVVVVGDVNPGSEIIADGNVIVLGALKGMVHAGVIGDDTCYISALSLTPTQMRIAGTITYIPPEEVANSKDSGPARAYIKDGQVFVEQL